MKKNWALLIVVGFIFASVLAALLLNPVKTLADLTYEGTGDYFSAPTVRVTVTNRTVTVKAGNNFTYLGDTPLDVAYVDYAISFYADGEYLPMLESASQKGGGNSPSNFRLNPGNVILIDLGVDQSGSIGRILPGSGDGIVS